MFVFIFFLVSELLIFMCFLVLDPPFVDVGGRLANRFDLLTCVVVVVGAPVGVDAAVDVGVDVGVWGHCDSDDVAATDEPVVTGEIVVVGVPIFSGGPVRDNDFSLYELRPQTPFLLHILS